MATRCVPQLVFGFQARTTVRFDGGSLPSDAGLLLREFDHGFRLTEDLARAYEDPWRADRIEHSILALLRQRVYQNVRLKKLAEPLIARARRRFKRTNENVRMFTSLRNRGRRWQRSRRVPIKVEISALGTNVRFVVTNRPGQAHDVFAWYNDRGVAERTIDELKNGLAFDRRSCSRYRANALRVQLHAVAYALVQLFRQRLSGTPLATATVTTL